MSVEALISRTVTVEGYINPVAFDQNRTSTYGYWICKLCLSSFFGGGEPIHDRSCSVKDRSYIRGYSQSALIYVLGPNEDGQRSSYKIKDIERIKELAKQHFLANKN